jgi:diguanylate cyclase (GGDEF)-like protein
MLVMSPIRPEREEDCSQSGEEGRLADALRATPVSGPAEVQARVELHLAQCRRRRGALALLCVRVDRVSAAGAAAGAEAERQVRHEVAHRIGHAVRGSDAILRESDRDTCVVLVDAGAAIAARVSKRLQHLLEGDYRVGDELLQVHVRVGAATHPEHGLRAAELLQRATDAQCH